MNFSTQLWIEPVGDLILIRLRGTLSAGLIIECQKRLIQLLNETNQRKILYDILEVDSAPDELTMIQWGLDQTIEEMTLRRAVVVPNSRLAYMSRIAFGEPDLKIFYNDMAGAIRWLTNEI